MALELLDKDPDDELDYTFNFAGMLGADTISSFVLDVPVGLTQPTPGTNDDTTVTVWLAGGTNLTIYTIGCVITTVGGRVKDKAFRLRIVEED